MISERLKQLRNELGLNKKQAADMFNLPYTTYSNYETGYREPNSDMLIKFSDKYNVSIDYLLGRSNHRKNITETIKSIKEQDLIQKYRQLDPRGQKAVDDTLEREYQYILKEEPILSIARSKPGEAKGVEEITDPEQRENIKKAFELPYKDLPDDI